MESGMKLFIALVACLVSLFYLGPYAFSAKKYDPVHGYPPPIGVPLVEDEDVSVINRIEPVEYDVALVDSKTNEIKAVEYEEELKKEELKKEEPKSDENKEKDETVDAVALPQQIEGLNLVGYSDAGKKSWDIKGETADIVGNKVNVTKVDANSYGREDTNLTARKGQINRTTGNVHLENDVVITSQNGAQMKTETLDWNRGENIVRTQDVVTLEDEIMKIKGKGMEAHPALKVAKLDSNVTADIKVQSQDQKKDNRIQITSDGSMEIDQATQKAIFTDHVVAEELSTGRVLKADRMEVLFDEKTKKVKEIVCTGNVEVHQDNNVTHSDSLVYKADEQRTLLKGRPKLIIDAKEADTSSVFKF